MLCIYLDAELLLALVGFLQVLQQTDSDAHENRQHLAPLQQTRLVLLPLLIVPQHFPL
jgi:hypothetical protein